ncbi:putative capsular polysaccharide export domain protein [Bordetella holmesii 41130]|nr:putative capsular polysaccharide export domain protein [Bordetella holmesii 41130]
MFRFLPLVILMGLSGCSILAGSGPTRGAIMDAGTAQGADAPGAYDVVDVNASTIEPYVLKRPPEVDGNTSDGYAGNMRARPGDVLRILVADSMEGGCSPR